MVGSVSTTGSGIPAPERKSNLSLSDVSVGSFASQCFLGFDSRTKTHKVLNVPYIFINRYPKIGRAQLRILSLQGTGSWREMDWLPHELIAAFEVGYEEFQILPLPEGMRGCAEMIEVGKHVAVIKDNWIWILEDWKKQVWKKQSLNLPGPYRDVCIQPVCTINNGEILLCSSSCTSKLWYCGMGRNKKFRKVQKLSNFRI